MRVPRSGGPVWHAGRTATLSLGHRRRAKQRRTEGESLAVPPLRHRGAAFRSAHSLLGWNPGACVV